MTNSVQNKESEQTESAYIYACLPVPPSVNHYWLPCKGSNKRRISPEGKVYRLHIACLIDRMCEGFFIKRTHEISPEECLSITGEYFLPDTACHLVSVFSHGYLPVMLCVILWFIWEHCTEKVGGIQAVFECAVFRFF